MIRFNELLIQYIGKTLRKGIRGFIDYFYSIAIYHVERDDLWTGYLGFTNLATEEREETIEEIKSLIQSLGNDHPNIFAEYDIDAEDYQRELKDAIFSLGGTFRQSHGTENEDIVRDVFLNPAREAGYLRFTDQRGSERIDFKGEVTDSEKAFAMDIKGGEGQSIGHLLVPTNTDLLVIWSERSARNTKSPASRLNEVINRTVRWALNQSESPQFMIIRDPPAGARTDDGRVIPDIVVFPSEYPSPTTPAPAMPSLDDMHFLNILLEVTVGIESIFSESAKKHIWWHEMEYRDEGGEKIYKRIYNAADESIRLRTQPIDYSRISNVE